ncbi:HNH endonuclease [Halosimplex carlsbadense]|uniref:HNH endonuclease n=1 Tax=Halosimplex carlsbadense TaxID=171164 RepID=UPI0009E333BD
MFGRGSGVSARWDDPDTYEGKYPPDWDFRRKAVYERDNYTCQYCGVRSGPHAGDGGAVLHAHHQIPLNRGGGNHLENLATVCQSCHDRAHGHPTGRNYENRGYKGVRILRRTGNIFIRIIRRFL